MIQLRSVLHIADNSGAKRIRVIQVHGGSRRRFGHVGDIVAASVILSDSTGSVKRGELVKAVIVRTRKEVNFRHAQVLMPSLTENGKLRFQYFDIWEMNDDTCGINNNKTP